MLLRVEGLTKRFAGASALTDIGFDVNRESRIVALVGPNGSGKTTILNIICGFLRQDLGKLELDGYDLAGWSPDRRARFGIRRTFQGSNLFDGLSVERNGRLALRSPPRGNRQSLDGSETMVEPALEQFELGEVRHHDASHISFGQRKMLSLLMATIRPFKLLLLDEPVAGLQPRLVELVADLIGKMDGMIIVVEHNFEFIERLGAHVLFLAEGRLIESGSLRDVLAAPAVRRAYS